VIPGAQAAPGRGTHHGDLAIAAALALGTLASRWPFRARLLYNWDAVQFALALREFDPAKHQPHPPGYPLYVGLARLVNGWAGDPSLAYVALAALFSALTTFTVYYLALRLYDRLTALTAALLLAASPLFWFYGAVGLTYAGEALGASLTALLAWGALRGSVRHLYAGAVCLGLAGGLRPSVLLLLLPLLAGAALAGIRAPRRLVAAGALLVGAVLAWLVPLVGLSGGPGPYARASLDLYGSTVLPTSVVGGAWEATAARLPPLAASVLAGLGPLALGFLALPGYLRRRGLGTAERFLLGWIAPPAAFYALVHFGQAGYVLSFLPALVVLLTRVVLGTILDAAREPRWRWTLTAAVLVPVVWANTAFFVSARPAARQFDDRPGEPWVARLRDEAHEWIMSRTAAGLREHEAVIQTYVEAIRARFSPADTVLVTELGNSRSYTWLRHAMFYLAEFPVYQIRVGAEPPGVYAPGGAASMILTPGTAITLPRRVKRLVWFVDHWDPAAPRLPGLEEVALPYGRFLYVLPLDTGPVHHAGYAFVRGDS
jgi:hypothetical protein